MAGILDQILTLLISSFIFLQLVSCHHMLFPCLLMGSCQIMRMWVTICLDLSYMISLSGLPLIILVPGLLACMCRSIYFKLANIIHSWFLQQVSGPCMFTRVKTSSLHFKIAHVMSLPTIKHVWSLHCIYLFLYLYFLSSTLVLVIIWCLVLFTLLSLEHT